jgi:hypothetical protein
MISKNGEEHFLLTCLFTLNKFTFLAASLARNRRRLRLHRLRLRLFVSVSSDEFLTTQIFTYVYTVFIYTYTTLDTVYIIRGAVVVHTVYVQ